MTPFAAVLFDCDGVLVDSEPITMRVLRDMLIDAGWQVTLQECFDLFVGKTVRSERLRIEQETGQPLTDEWMQTFYARRNVALERELEAIAGAVEMMPQVKALVQGKIACASGADRAKVELQLDKVGLLSFFEGQVFVGHEMPRTKPFPDVYLAAAKALLVDPAQCLVVEDTVTGVTAGVAAGATVVGYCPTQAPQGQAQALRAAGAVHVMEHMAELPDWMQSAVVVPTARLL